MQSAILRRQGQVGQDQIEQARRYRKLQFITDRLLRLAMKADADELLLSVDRYLTRIETWSLGRTDLDAESKCEQACLTLRQYRKDLGLSQPSLAMLCNLNAQLVESRYSTGEVIAHLRQLYNGCKSRIDSTHISKFERGHDLPWTHAIELLTKTIGILRGETISPDQLFPEIDRSQRQGGKSKIYEWSQIINLQQELAALPAKPMPVLRSIGGIRGQRVKHLASRLMNLSIEAGDRIDLDAIEFYVGKLESIYDAEDYPDAERVHGRACLTLRQYRKDLGLSQPGLAMMVTIYGILSEQGYAKAKLAAQLRRVYQEGCESRIDTTHISHFERGCQLPWPRAIALLSSTIEILADEPMSPEKLFPEVNLDEGNRNEQAHVRNQRYLNAEALQHEFASPKPKPQPKPRRKSKRSRRRPTCGLFDDDPIVITPEQIDVLHEIARELV